MPIYDYLCTKCGGVFEKLILTPTSAVVCPACGSRHVEQMVSAPAIHNTSSKNDALNREYRDYNKRWAGNAYSPKPQPKSKTR